MRPADNDARSASEWMDRTGIGKVYSGIATLDVSDCRFERGIPIVLVLEEGDPKTNRVPL